MTGPARRSTEQRGGAHVHQPAPAAAPPRVGERYGRTHWEHDGIEYLLGAYGHEVRVVLGRLREREVARIGGEGEVELALVAEPLVFSVLAAVEGVIPWSGAPWSWHAVPEQERALPPPLRAGEETGLTLVLVEAEDGIVRAVRPLTLSAQFSLALDGAIREQAEQPFDQEEYERQAAALAAEWQAGTLVDRACARWSSGRSGSWRG